MGNICSCGSGTGGVKGESQLQHVEQGQEYERKASSLRRIQAVTELKYASNVKLKPKQRPVGSCPVQKEDIGFITVCAGGVILFRVGKLPASDGLVLLRM